MKKLIVLSALSMFMASAYATNHCPAGQSCTYPIGVFSNDKTIYFTELQPQHVYRCSFNLDSGSAKVTAQHTGLTAGVQVSPHGGFSYFPAVFSIDTMGIPATQTVGNAAWFYFKAISFGRYKMTLQCSVVK